MAQDTPTNRLIHEKSPYLLQHARNPVDWYPWGAEAFEKAKKEDKPIFLSIGYSTCHWCHVMEEESFENAEIAKMMNEYFVPIKVDREERPDVDQVYMQAVMAMSGSGGWPMSIFLTPERQPFYGGTYFPPEDRWGRPGFKTVLVTLARKWETERRQVLDAGRQMTEALQDEMRSQAAQSAVLDLKTLQKGYEQYQSQFDPEHGGFGSAPKFPRSHSLSLLLRFGKRTREGHAMLMAEQTLVAMAHGGLMDHLGGGFHRYSTDGEWHVPHFEKMLYDQALLARTYLEAYQATGKAFYGDVARKTLDYVLRQMTHANGGVYSAEDADSAADAAKPHEKTEGAFYLWDHAEVAALLGPEKAALFSAFYDVRPEGNAAHDPQGEFEGLNILRERQTVQELALHFKKDEPEILKILAEAKTQLWKVREARPRPHLDDKILTDWNGLMIATFAQASRILEEPRYGDAARRAADFFIKTMITPKGRLMHRWREGEVAIPGFLEDYAFFIHGLLDLYEATFEVHYLELARTLTLEMLRLFWDESSGGFFLTGKDAEAMITKAKEIYDGAIPSGNSVAILDLLRVGRITMDEAVEAKAAKALEVFSGALTRFPSGYPQMLIALDFLLGPSREIVLAGKAGDPGWDKMFKILYRPFVPNKVMAFHPADGDDAKAIEALVPFIKNQVALEGKPTVYLCENYHCKLPVTDPAELAKILEG